MNKRELIAVLADKLDLSKTAAASMLHTVIETVIEEVENGHKVQLSGFGSFQASKRASRTLRNPSTGDLLQVAESKAVSFRAGQTFKDAVNKRK
ncbi:MAG: HU family DNA-binding protein [Janthinobacterium lividum]